MMTESKALNIAEKFVDYLEEIKDMTEICTTEDIEALRYLIDTYHC